MNKLIPGTRYFRRRDDIISYSGENLTATIKEDLKDEGWKKMTDDEYTAYLNIHQNRQQAQVKGEHGTNIDV